MFAGVGGGGAVPAPQAFRGRERTRLKGYENKTASHQVSALGLGFVGFYQRVLDEFCQLRPLNEDAAV